jgi:hypothetical protein
MDAAATSSANGGLTPTTGIIGMIGGTARNSADISSGGRCEARIGMVDAGFGFICRVQSRLPLHYKIVAEVVESGLTQINGAT